MTDPLGHVTTSTYNKNEDPNRLTDPEGNSARLVYNDRGLVHQVKDANGGVTEYAYDDNGNVIQIQDARGHLTHYAYDRFDSLIRTTHEGGTCEELYYDRNNRITCRINREGQAILYEYDALGRMVVKARPSDPNIEFAYDISGRLTDVNDGANTIQYTYDRLGRVASITDADHRTVSYDYDARGLRTRLTYPGGAVLSGGDPESKTRHRKPPPGRRGETVGKFDRGRAFQHGGGPKHEKGDKKENKPKEDRGPQKPKKPKKPRKDQKPPKPKPRQCAPQPQGLSIVYLYDNLGRIEQIATDANDVLAQYAYDELSRRTHMTLGNGASAAYEYDLANRLTKLTHHVSGTDVLTFDYPDYDRVGNRLSARTNADPAQVYTYDNRYQLTLVDYNDGTSTAYQYDRAGNRTQVDQGSVTHYFSNGLNQYTVMGGTSLEYDANGNLTGSGGNTSYEYDCENRLTGVLDQNGNAVASYTYDYLGRRIGKTLHGSPDIITQYVYDGDQVIAEYDGSDMLLRQFVYGPGIDEPICMIDAAHENAVYYYHLDGLGSVAALSEENNTIAERYSYSVFGEPNRVSDVNNPYLFTGRRFDTETRLYHYRARAYAYDIGRFLQPDPIGLSDGINLYAYCGNNPVGFVDPYGLCKGDGSWGTSLDAVQHALDAGGMWPGVGFFPDAANTLISALRGHWGDAAFSAGAMLPLLGQGSTAAKWAKRGAAGNVDSAGAKVYRVWGDDAMAWGRSWTTTDPRTVSKYRNAAGLPNENTGRFISEGILDDASGVRLKSADPLHGNTGGLPELVVPNPERQIRLQNVQGVNLEF